MKRRIGIFVLVVIVFGMIGVRLWQQWPGDGAAVAGSRGGAGRSVDTAIAERGDVSQAVTLVGSLRAQERVEVTPKVGGRVVEMLVDLGDAVQRGQLLARLEDEELQQQVQQLEAGLEVARAVVQQRELELKNQGAALSRNKGLHETGVISAEQLEEAQTRRDVSQAQLNLARAQLVQSEAGLRERRIRLSQTRILAPISGLVGHRFVDLGARVNASTPVVTLIKLDTVELIAAVPERQLARVVKGAKGIVVVDALPGERFEGVVARISPLLDPQTRTAQIEIVIDNPDLRLKAEMFARVDLDLGSKRKALRVPRSALVVRGQRQGVFVIDEDVALFHELEIGLTETDWVEVVSGLQAGDTVATLGANLLRDGDPVRVAGESSKAQETST